MPQATYNYVYFAAGPHQRQPRVNSGPGGFTQIQSGSYGGYSPGDLFTPPPVPQPYTPEGPDGPAYQFAFANYLGVTATDPNSLPTVTVGTDPINVLAVYVPIGGDTVGPPEYGATIDSFDEVTQALFDDTFVTVSPATPEGPLSNAYVNEFGYVDTTDSTEAITALSPTSPTGVDFDYWLLLYPQVSFRIERVGGVFETIPVYPAGITVDGAILTVDSGTSVSALAFYKAPPVTPPTTCEELLRNFDALEPKTNIVLLEYYREKLSQCHGPQYTAAVNEINGLLGELKNLRPPAR